jgi:hypothetical protein
MSKTLLTTLALSASLLAACGGATPPPQGAEGADGKGPASSGPAGEAGGRDPKIVELMQPALACKFEDGAFDDECPALKAWADNEDLFADEKGDATLFSMFGDPEVKVRLLADKKTISSRFFADQERAVRLFALAKAEKDDGVADALARYVAKIDAEKLGLGAQLKELGKHPSKRFRETLAFYLVSTFQSPVALEVEQMLFEDPERDVRRKAVSALSSGGVTPGVEPVCKLLTKQLARTDDLHGEALWAGGSSKCPGMKDQVAAELDRRTKDPSKVTNAMGISYGLNHRA